MFKEFCMKKKNTFLLGLLVVLLAIGLVLVGCSDGDSGDNSDYNSGGNNTGGTSVPSAPTQVNSLSIGKDSIEIYWDLVAGATGYYVYRSTNNNNANAFIRVGEPTSTTSTSAIYKDTGLYADTYYLYKVSAYNSAGESSLSAYIEVRTLQSSSGGTSVPSAPTGVTATGLSSSSISVSWSQVSGATSYDVYYEIGSSTTKNLAGNTTSTSYTHTGLTASTTYYYYIKAKNSAGSSDYSSLKSATTLSSSSGGGGTSVPSAPTGVTATRQSASNVYITWNAVSGATSYKVYWSYTYSGTYSLAGTTSSTNYTDSGWGASETGYIKVSAVNSAGEGSQSSAASFPAYTSGGGGGTTWPPTVANTFDGTGVSSTTSQYFNGTLSSTSSVLWYKISWPSAYSEITIMGLDRQYGSSYTADIVASLYGSSGSLMQGPVNIGYLASIDSGVSSLSTYYIKVEVNPSSPYTGTFRIGLGLK